MLCVGCVFLLISSVAALSDARTIPATQPVAAKVANLDPKHTDWDVGDIKVTLANGTSAVFTHERTCALPKVSSSGDVGWSVWLDSNNDRYEHSGELLRVRMHDGTLADFHPNSRFIKDWDFAKDDTTVAIQSMGYHGHSYYIEYDLKTGRILDHIDEYKPYAELPAWAQPIADDKP